jgi:hypothetical protein
MATPAEINRKVEDLARRVEAVKRKKVELAALVEAKKAELSRLVNEIKATGFDPTDLVPDATRAERDLAAMVAAFENDIVATERALAFPDAEPAAGPCPSSSSRRGCAPMPSLKQTLADLHARHTREILDVLAGASIQDFQDVVAGPRGEPSGSKAPRASSRSSKAPATTSHAIELLAANLVAHLKKHGPLRSEELRRAMGISRQDMVKALTLATAWKVMGRKGEKRSTTYYAKKTPGPKPQITLGDRMRVAAVMK